MEDTITLTCPRCATFWEKSLKTLERVQDVYRNVKEASKPAGKVVNYLGSLPGVRHLRDCRARGGGLAMPRVLSIREETAEKKVREWFGTQALESPERSEEAARLLIGLITGLLGALFAVLTVSAETLPAYLYLAAGQSLRRGGGDAVACIPAGGSGRRPAAQVAGQREQAGRAGSHFCANSGIVNPFGWRSPSSLLGWRSLR